MDGRNGTGEERWPRPDLEVAFRLYREWVRGLFRAAPKQPLIPGNFTGSITYHYYEGSATNVETRVSTKNSNR